MNRSTIKMKNIIIITFLTFFISALAFGQEEKEIDPSKPTNLYTQVNANLEYSAGKSNNLYGLRANIQYALNPDNLFMFEVPFLYNDATKKFGVYDMRVRYFAVVSRNISQNFIAIAPFADITAPTGKFENGLGTSAWSLAAGCVLGFVVSQQIALFPGISGIYITKAGTDLIPDDAKKSSTGVGFQFNLSYRFSQSSYLFINPTPALLNRDGIWKASWMGEFSLNHIFIPNKLKMNLFWGPNFTNEVHAFRLGGTLYF